MKAAHELQPDVAARGRQARVTFARRAFAARFPGRRLIVVSNREPYQHVWREGTLRCERPAGGLVSALDPVLQALGGIWIAWGSGAADRETAERDGSLQVPPDAPAYTLQRVWLDAATVRGYYLGYANRGLWPLSHMLIERSRFDQADWQQYRRANALFARAVEARARVGDVVWVHDFHLALVPRMVRQREPDARIAYFWHIPWPPAEVFRLCPQRRALLRGLLGADLIGFHVPGYQRNFLDCAESILGLPVDRERGVVHHAGGVTSVRALPISIDAQWFRAAARSPRSRAIAASVRRRFAAGGARLGVAVDRLDYTKGIQARMRGLQRFFELHPEQRGRVTLLQVLVPTRSEIDDYAVLRREVSAMVAALNRELGTADWKPVVSVTRSLHQQDLAALYRAADFAIVSPLVDGMNLVAKEFVISQLDGHGVLLLSESAGAAWELTDALSFSPLDPDGIAEALRQAIDMPAAERGLRLKRMQELVARQDVYAWIADTFAALAACDREPIAPAGPAEAIAPSADPSLSTANPGEPA